jgi:hypothetical protein
VTSQKQVKVTIHYSSSVYECSIPYGTIFSVFLSDFYSHVRKLTLTPEHMQQWMTQDSWTVKEDQSELVTSHYAFTESIVLIHTPVATKLTSS